MAPLALLDSWPLRVLVRSSSSSWFRCLCIAAAMGEWLRSCSASLPKCHFRYDDRLHHGRLNLHTCIFIRKGICDSRRVAETEKDFETEADLKAWEGGTAHGGESAEFVSVHFLLNSFQCSWQDISTLRITDQMDLQSAGMRRGLEGE